MIWSTSKILPPSSSVSANLRITGKWPATCLSFWRSVSSQQVRSFALKINLKCIQFSNPVYGDSCTNTRSSLSNSQCSGSTLTDCNLNNSDMASSTCTSSTLNDVHITSSTITSSRISSDGGQRCEISLCTMTGGVPTAPCRISGCRLQAA